MSVSFKEQEGDGGLARRERRRERRRRRRAAQDEGAPPKPVAIIDLARSPFRELTPSPERVIVLSDEEAPPQEPAAPAPPAPAAPAGPQTPPPDPQPAAPTAEEGTSNSNVIQTVHYPIASINTNLHLKLFKITLICCGLLVSLNNRIQLVFIYVVWLQIQMF